MDGLPVGADREVEVARLRAAKADAERALQAVFQAALARYLPEYYTGALSTWSGDALDRPAGTPPFERALLKETLESLGLGGDAVQPVLVARTRKL